MNEDERKEVEEFIRKAIATEVFITDLDNRIFIYSSEDCSKSFLEMCDRIAYLAGGETFKFMPLEEWLKKYGGKKYDR